MANLVIRFNDFSDMLSKYCKESKIISDTDIDNCKKLILAAVTVAQNNAPNNDSGTKCDSVNDVIGLWQNEITPPSQLLIGNNCIIISDLIKDFIKLIIAEKIWEKIPDFNFNNSDALTLGAGVLFSLIESRKKLDDFQMCLYLKIFGHYFYNPFKVDEISELYRGMKCDMHGLNCKCGKYVTENDQCIMTDITNEFNELIALGVVRKRNDEYYSLKR